MMRVLVLLGICVLVAGCAPVAGIKGIAALFISIVAAGAAVLFRTRKGHESRVCQKAKTLDDAVTAHQARFRRTALD